MFGLKTPAYQTRQRLSAGLPDYPVASAISPDNTRLAVATADGRMHLYSLTGSQDQRHWHAHDAAPRKLAWHPGSVIVSSGGEDGLIRHWTLDGGQDRPPKVEAGTGTSWIEDIAWRPDGRCVAVASGRKASIIDATGKLLNTLDFAASTIAALAWNPRGTELALAGYRGIALVSKAMERPRQRQLEWQGSLLTCLWSPDGRILAACCQDNAVHFWRLANGRDASMSGYSAKPRAMGFSPDSRYLVTGGSDTMTSWEFANGGPEGMAPHELSYHRDLVTVLAVDQTTCHVAAGARDGVISLWEGPAARRPYYHFAMPASPVAVHWACCDNRTLVVVIDSIGTIGVWELYVA